MGINPSLKGTSLSQKFPYVIFCAPPSRSPDYPGDLRYALIIIQPNMGDLLHDNHFNPEFLSLLKDTLFLSVIHVWILI